MSMKTSKNLSNDNKIQRSDSSGVTEVANLVEEVTELLHLVVGGAALQPNDVIIKKREDILVIVIEVHHHGNHDIKCYGDRQKCPDKGYNNQGKQPILQRPQCFDGYESC